MTIADQVVAEMAGLREHAESLMTATCEIRRAAVVSGQIDDANGRPTSTTLAPYYIGKCRVWVESAAQALPQNVAEQAVTTQLVSLSVPWATVVQVGDLVHITDTADAYLLGETLTVRTVRPGQWLIRRRAVCAFDETRSAA